MPSRFEKLDIDALFQLACGCIMDGCSGSDPARKHQAGVAGYLRCATRGNQTLVSVVSLNTSPETA